MNTLLYRHSFTLGTIMLMATRMVLADIQLLLRTEQRLSVTRNQLMHTGRPLYSANQTIL